MRISNQWLLLLYGLPTKKSAARVNLWRQLKKCGAFPLKTSAYLLPDKAEHHERFQWLAQQVRDGGGEATIIHVTEIEGLASDASSTKRGQWITPRCSLRLPNSSREIESVLTNHSRGTWKS
jgi:hypothetical protein